MCGRYIMSAKARKRSKGADGGRSDRDVARNRKAGYLFQFIETVEAGIALTGNEVKSVREGGVSLGESYARVRDGEIYLVGCHIAPYGKTGFDRPDPLRDRKLLLGKAEIRRLGSRVVERGFTLVPTRLYFKGPWAKVELALARGKRSRDKRADIKKRQQNRDVARLLASRSRGRMR